MMKNTVALIFITIAIGTKSVTYGSPLPTASTPENEEAIQSTAAPLIPSSEGESTVASPSVTIAVDGDYNSDEEDEIEAVQATDALMNPSSEIASTVEPPSVTADVDGDTDSDGNEAVEAVQATDTPLSPSFEGVSTVASPA